MYTVVQLSKILNVSRKTIYDKFEREELKPHIQTGDKRETYEETMSTHDKSNCIEIEYLKKNIEYLERQVEELKLEKTEIQQRLDSCMSVILDWQKNQLLLQQPKRKFLGFFPIG